MALTGLEIYKLLPKTNCRECGFPTCLAFAMQLAKKAVSLDKCPYLSPEAKKALEQAALPPIRLVSLGKSPNLLEVGNETVMFRHEEKFYHPTGIGIILDDSLSKDELDSRLSAIKRLEFERVGQVIKIDLLTLKQTKSGADFLNLVKKAVESLGLAIVLMSEDLKSLTSALEVCAAAKIKPLLYRANSQNYQTFAKLAKNYKAALVVSAADLTELSELTKKVNELGIEDLILQPQADSLSEKIWTFTQIRRLALKKSFRSLGYPVISLVENPNATQAIIETAVAVAKYSGIVLVDYFAACEILPILTLRQNIYTDPQKPLQVEPKLYPVGAAGDKSPVLVTTNFSLTYYTVLSEVEASKIPSHILVVDTEGMSVLTAWAAEKFTPEKIAESLNKFVVKEKVSHNNLIIPGYVAVMSGDLEEKSGSKILVGPKEAAGIPAFLKNL